MINRLNTVKKIEIKLINRDLGDLVKLETNSSCVKDSMRTSTVVR